MPEVAEKVSELEWYMMRLANEHAKTEMELQRLNREMREFKNEMRASKKENDRRWGDLVNKMGTLVEDIVAPSLPRIVKEDFGCAEIDDFMINRRIRNKRQKTVTEIDALVIAGNTLFINETKSTPKIEYVNKFMDKIKQLPDILPDYEDKKLIPLFSSLSIPEDIVNYLTKNGIYAIAMGEDVMQVINLQEVQSALKNE